ncbi:prepilin-type N-terminal cleavage/methylation domain-containing protein [Candidatus Poribacteria bacterium]|nr:prepilin-type N-terminal cleavage/methylation domain-containing protein [Candidatus Poribacteria bacterium]
MKSIGTIFRRPARGFTLIEVLVALALLLAGVVAVIQLFPVSLKANSDAALTGTAALLAQQKVEEIRRDNDLQARLTREIRERGAATTPISWPVDPRLTYSFGGSSEITTSDTPDDPRDDFRVARVIVRLAPGYDPSEKVIYELRFDR